MSPAPQDEVDGHELSGWVRAICIEAAIHRLCLGPACAT
jgi:hypothetical protein